MSTLHGCGGHCQGNLVSITVLQRVGFRFDSLCMRFSNDIQYQRAIQWLTCSNAVVSAFRENKCNAGIPNMLDAEKSLRRSSVLLVRIWSMKSWYSLNLADFASSLCAYLVTCMVRITLLYVTKEELGAITIFKVGKSTSNANLSSPRALAASKSNFNWGALLKSVFEGFCNTFPRKCKSTCDGVDGAKGSDGVFGGAGGWDGSDVGFDWSGCGVWESVSGLAFFGQGGSSDSSRSCFLVCLPYIWEYNGMRWASCVQEILACLYSTSARTEMQI